MDLFITRYIGTLTSVQSLIKIYLKGPENVHPIKPEAKCLRIKIFSESGLKKITARGKSANKIITSSRGKPVKATILVSEKR